MSEEDQCDSLDSSFGSLSLSFKSTLSDDQYLEDGPVFRATIQQLENRTSALKQSLKRIIKTATTLLETRRYLARINQNYIDALRNAPYLEPLMSHFLDGAASVIDQEQKKIDMSLQTQLIDSLRHIYEHDIKMAEFKRRQFEDISKDYYASLAKYLKASKKNDDAVNQQARKRKFDLARFDYFAFLVDLHGGKKENEILFSVADHTIRNFGFFETVAAKLTEDKSGLDELTTLMTINSREQEQSNLERAAKRKELQDLCLSGAVEEEPVEDVDLVAPPVEEDKFKGIRDLEQHRDGTGMGRKKEGFLFATAKPAKSLGFDVTSSSVPWHKYWCVLSNGQLHEYSNWKRQLEPHIEPINLRFATVREARNVERRFCLEVITPHMRRVYQATSAEETASWIATIQNAIESLLNGTSSSACLQEVPEVASQKSRHSRTLSGIKSSLSAAAAGKSAKRQSNTPAEGAELLVSASAPNERFRWSGFSFGHTHGNQKLAAGNGHFLFSALPDSNTKLISILREEPSNHYCVDCGASNPDWCSLNLGVLLCIECSGIHRSLGTHVSKIRSLTLDSTSYTPDIIELLRSIGNARSNAIWDPRNDGSSPSATDSRNIKLAYIQQKYVGRAYVKRDETELPSQLLFDAIDRDNIPDALKAIALGASPNATRPSDLNSPRISLMAPMYTPFFMDFDSGSNKVETTDTKDEHYVVRYALHYALLHGRQINKKDILEEPNNIKEEEEGEKDEEDHNGDDEEKDEDEEEHVVGGEEKEKGRTIVFPMAEFLLQNGADTGIVDPETGHTVSDLVSLGSVLGDGAIAYINMKNTARGQSTITRSSVLVSPQMSLSTTTTNTTTVPEKST